MYRIALLCILTLLPGAAAAAPPAGLLGKTVTVSWGENRSQRPVGTTAIQSISNSVDWTLYISTQGRFFSRQFRQSSGAAGSKGHGKSATRDRAPGDSPSPGVQATQVSFQGNTMVHVAKYPSGARQIVINFDAGFGSCTAHVLQGKEGGATHQLIRSQITGAMLEVFSVQIGGANCSVRAGNPFGG